MPNNELKDFKQRFEEGEFAQSAELSTRYLDENILIFDNIRVLANPDPVRLQMNMIASCQAGNVRLNINGKVIEIGKNDIFVCPPNNTLDIMEVSPDFACTAMCLSNLGLQNILHSHISIWNRAMYVDKVSVVKMTEEEMLFYAKFTDLVRLVSMPTTCSLHRGIPIAAKSLRRCSRVHCWRCATVFLLPWRRMIKTLLPLQATFSTSSLNCCSRARSSISR